MENNPKKSKKLGNKLIELRKAKGWNQSKMADLLSVSTNTISNYETGLSYPRPEKISKIIDYFEISPNELFGESDMVSPEKSNSPEIIRLLVELRDKYDVDSDLMSRIQDEVMSLLNDILNEKERNIKLREKQDEFAERIRKRFNLDL